MMENEQQGYQQGYQQYQSPYVGNGMMENEQQGYQHGYQQGYQQYQPPYVGNGGEQYTRVCPICGSTDIMYQGTYTRKKNIGVWHSICRILAFILAFIFIGFAAFFTAFIGLVVIVPLILLISGIGTLKNDSTSDVVCTCKRCGYTKPIKKWK